MNFTLFSPCWFGFQMFPGYGAGRCVPFFAPVYVERVQPLKTGQGELEIDYFNPFYAEGAQNFAGVRLKMLLRADNYLLARLVDKVEPAGTRAVVLSHIEFGWLAACCPGLLAALPPESLGSLCAGSISMYLDRVFLHREWEMPERSLDDQPENDWLIACALRFDGYRYAQKHGLPDQASDFAEWFMRSPDLGHEPEFFMTAMFMLQRRLMKEGVDNKTSQAWKRFRQLFIQLCDDVAPEEFRGSRHQQWEQDFRPRLRLGREIVLAMHTATRYGPHLF